MTARGPRAALGPRAVYLLYAGGSALFFASYSTLANVYRVRVAHLDALQLVLVGTVLESAALLFEVPTGVLADAVSRRLSVVVGLALTGVGFLLEGSFPVFGVILMAQFVWGAGGAFESAAADAWIADELGEGAAASAFLRAAQVGQASALAGIALAAVLGRFHLAWALLAGGAGFLALAAAVGALMREAAPAVRGPAATDVLVRLRSTFVAGWEVARGRALVRRILTVALLAGAASEVFDRLWQARLLGFSLPLQRPLGTAGVFGLVAAVAMVGSLGATEVARRRIDATQHRATATALMGLTAVLAVSVAGFGLAGHAGTALAFYFVAILVRRVNAPLFRAWLNQSASRGVRATLFSFANQMDALGQIAAGPALGALALEAGMPWAFVACALLLVPAILVYARTLRSGTAPVGGPEDVLP